MKLWETMGSRAFHNAGGRRGQSSLCDACFSPPFAMRASVLPLRCVLQSSLCDACFSPPFGRRASVLHLRGVLQPFVPHTWFCVKKLLLTKYNAEIHRACGKETTCGVRLHSDDTLGPMSFTGLTDSFGSSLYYIDALGTLSNMGHYSYHRQTLVRRSIAKG